MKILLDRDNPLPAYRQIAEAVREQLASGTLAPGSELPTRSALAKQLGVHLNTVAQAYRLLKRDGLLETRTRSGTRVVPSEAPATEERAARLQLLTTRMISDGLAHGYTLAELEAAFIEQRERWQAKRQSRPTDRQIPAHVLGIGSQDASLDVLLAELRAGYPSHSFEFAAVGSLAGLMALARGEVHFAAMHLYDDESGDFNLPIVRRLMPERRCALITLAFRTQGLLVARGNPRKIRGVRDLTRAHVRFVNRQAGSGTRTLLDRLLRDARLTPARIAGYRRELPTHTAVAAEIAGRRADVGLGIEAVARAFELDFVPLAGERYELVTDAHSPLLRPIRAVLQRTEYRETVQALGGYDLSDCGAVRFSAARAPLKLWDT